MRPGRQWLLLALLATLASSCDRSSCDHPNAALEVPAATVDDERPAPSPALVAAARAQIGVTLGYDPTYRTLGYPGGDVSTAYGVCTDVIIRALRDALGLDLQSRIHEDMRAQFSAYPPLWGLRRADPNIDHRRVPNQMRWFERQGWQLPISSLPDDYVAGDIVTWKLNRNGLLHIGIVSDQRHNDGTPLILHNISRGTREENLLFQHPIIGHYRPPATL